ncbi:MAG: nucleotide pyrophosphohydrolase [Fibrobacter sp.]|jgi:NTP pyrophosphatase (non-canonical NTP hydrolase)|nr:nucleotide pyrophosphohydrolase [Fibrobacter sp.]
MADDLSLRGAQQLVDEWIRKYGVRYFGEMTNLAQLMEEVGELARLFSRTYGDQSFKAGESAEKIPEEMADILFVLICLANQSGVDLQEAFLQSVQKKTFRDAERHFNNPKLRV